MVVNMYKIILPKGPGGFRSLMFDPEQTHCGSDRIIKLSMEDYMRKFIVVAIVAALVITGCKSTGNAVGTVFNPVIGTWTSTTLGIETEMVINVDKTTTETVTVLGVSSTKNGTWDTNDKVLARKWSDGSGDKQYYSFNSNSKQLTLSKSSKGISTSYDRQ